jgi:hypothetical protein
MASKLQISAHMIRTREWISMRSLCGAALLFAAAAGALGCVGPATREPVYVIVVAAPPTPRPDDTPVERPSAGDAKPVVAKATASSEYDGWPATNAIDGDERTSWYSATNDSAARGRATYLQVDLVAPSRVSRVTVLGNRDPQYPKGYTVRAGRIDLLDASGTVLRTSEARGSGAYADFDLRLGAGVSGVKAVRFTSLDDEGNQNPFGDVAISEIRVR